MFFPLRIVFLKNTNLINRHSVAAYYASRTVARTVGSDQEHLKSLPNLETTQRDNRLFADDYISFVSITLLHSRSIAIPPALSNTRTLRKLLLPLSIVTLLISPTVCVLTPGPG